MLTVLFLLTGLSGCTIYTPVKRDPGLTKAIVKVPLENKLGIAFGPDIVWGDCISTLMDQWLEVDNGNDRLDVLRNK